MAISPDRNGIEGDIEGGILDDRLAVVEDIGVGPGAGDAVAAAHLHYEFSLVLGGKVTARREFLELVILQLLGRDRR